MLQLRSINKILSRNISSCFRPLREWKTIEARKFAQIDLPKVGEPIPSSLHIPKEKPEFPEYKYGESRIYKRSNKGLFGGRFIQFGNQISEKSKHKTRRSWKVNDHKKKFWSEAMQKMITIRVATKVLRTITKEGGIDNYLTKEKSARVKELGPAGWKLRFRVLQKQTFKKIENYETVTKEDGSEVKVYFRVGKEAITVGRRKLLSVLYGLELESNTDLSFKEFMKINRDEKVENILNKMKKLNYDVSEISFIDGAQSA